MKHNNNRMGADKKVTRAAGKYRRWMKILDGFCKFMPFWFLTGVVGCVIASLSKHQNAIGLVCALTIWPSLILWLLLSGSMIIWRFVLESYRCKARSGKMVMNPMALLILGLGILFVLGALFLLLTLAIN